jgi:hypothetical protein
MDVVSLATQVVSFLSPHLVKAGEKTVGQISDALPEAAGKVWQAIVGRFKGRAAAEEAVKDVVAQPQDDDSLAALRKELRKVLEAEPTFGDELTRLLSSAEREAGDTITQTGDGAIATRGGTAASRGGIAVGGDVHGDINTGRT